MANQLKVELIAEPGGAINNVDQFERKIVEAENQLGILGKRGNAAGRELAQGLGIPLGPTAALLAGIGLLTVGVGKAMAAAREGADANRVLGSSATEAGLSYDVATAQAQKFANITGLGATEAKQTFSSLLQVARVAGQVGDIEVIQKRFADLAAARGVAAKDLSTLAQQILSGQDEALNRMGLADPSKLAADWAKAHHTTVEAMTQTEQVASRLDAVMRKGAMFDGSAEERLASVSGQITKTEQAMANLTTGVGDAIFANKEFRDLLGELNRALESVGFTADDVRKKLKAGLTPEQIGKQAADEHQAMDMIKGGLSAIPAAYRLAWDVTFNEVEDAKRTFLNSVDPSQMRIDEATLSAAAEQHMIATQEAAATAQAAVNAQKIQSDKDAAAAKVTLADATKKLALEEAKQKANQELVISTFKDSRAFLDDMNERVNKDNPFVKLFGDADTVMERMHKRFGAFGEDFVQQMAKVESKAIEMEAIAARIQSAQKVLDIEAEIRKLQFGQIGTSAEDQRRLGVFGKQIDAARDIPTLEAKARAIDRAGYGQGPGALDQGAILKKQIEDVLRLKTQFFGTGAGDREAQSKINEQLISLFEGASPEMQAQLIKRGAGGFRGAISGAYQGQANDRRQAIEDEARRAEAGRFAVQAAQKKLADLTRFGGFDSDEVRKQYLAITGSLSEGELTPELRRGRIGALDVEAKKEAKKEEQAAKDREKLNEVLDLLKTQITGKGLKVDQATAGVLVEVKNQAANATITGPAFDEAAGRRSMQGF